MKRLNLTFCLLMIGVLAFITSCKQPATNQPTTTTTTSTAPAEEKSKIVYVNIDTLMAQYDFYKDSKKKLEDQLKSMQKEVETRAMAIQNEYIGYQKKGETMSPVEMQAAQKSLAEKEQSLNAYRAKVEESIVKEEQKLDKMLKDKINGYLSKKAEEKGYEYILSYTSSGIGMLYGSPKNDITQEVLTELNDLYKNEKK